MNLLTALSLLKLPEDCIQEDVQKAFTNQMSHLMHVLEGVRSPEENQRVQTQIRELENAYQTALSNVPKQRKHTKQESRTIPKSVVEINSAKKHKSSSASSKAFSVLGGVENKLAQLISTLFAKVPQFNFKQNNMTKSLARLSGRMSRKTKIIAGGVFFVLAPLTTYIVYEPYFVALRYGVPSVTEEFKQLIEAGDVKAFDRKFKDLDSEKGVVSDFYENPPHRFFRPMSGDRPVIIDSVNHGRILSVVHFLYDYSASHLIELLLQSENPEIIARYYYINSHDIYDDWGRESFLFTYGSEAQHGPSLCEDISRRNFYTHQLTQHVQEENYLDAYRASVLLYYLNDNFLFEIDPRPGADIDDLVDKFGALFKCLGLGDVKEIAEQYKWPGSGVEDFLLENAFTAKPSELAIQTAMFAHLNENQNVSSGNVNYWLEKFYADLKREWRQIDVKKNTLPASLKELEKNKARFPEEMNYRESDLSNLELAKHLSDVYSARNN